MTIKFLYPNHEQKEIIDELEKITDILSKPVSPQLKKNMHFINKFTHALLRAGKPYTESKQFKPEDTEIIKPYIPSKIITKKIEAPRKLAIPPPPLPPILAIEKHPNLPVYIKLKKEDNLLKYESLEPEMQQQDWKIFSKVKAIIKQQLMQNPNILENESFISDEIQKSAKEFKIKISPDYTKKIQYYLIKNIKGYGRIDPLINDNKVTSIICNSYDNINVIYNNESLQTNIQFETNEEMNNFILNLAERFNKQISEETPSLQFTTPLFKSSLNYAPLMGRSSFRIDKL